MALDPHRRLRRARADRPPRHVVVGSRRRVPRSCRAARERDPPGHPEPHRPPQRVTAETILGATCAYILFGLLFAFVYLALGELRDAPFFAQPGPHEASEYIYFSFVALTTLGFGDLSPAVGLPQALTVIEALLGSVFLVTLVARLVTLWVRQDELGHARG